MDVVQDVVRVLDLDLTRLHHDHVGHELAALLVEHRLGLGLGALGAGDGHHRVRSGPCRRRRPPSRRPSSPVPHFSVSLLTLSFSTTGGAGVLHVGLMVPPPCAPAGGGRDHIAAPATSGAPLRHQRLTHRLLLLNRHVDSCVEASVIDRTRRHRVPVGRSGRPSIMAASVRSATTGGMMNCRLRLRLLQPQIVPRGQRHLRAVSPSPPSHAWNATGVNTPGRKVGRPSPLAGQRPLDHEAVLAVVVNRLAGGFAAGERGHLGRPARARLADPLALLPAQQVHGVAAVAPSGSTDARCPR